MESLISSINEFIPYIIGGMGIIILLLFILVIILFKSLGKLENRYRKFMRGTNNKNLEELIISQLDKIESANSNSEKALEKCEFEDVGSDLSFSVAILDDNNDGIILTGIYGRNESTTYAKPIDKGISRYDLSEEEICVLNKAINKYNTKKK